MSNRIIKNGKLDICTELIGGASDGTLCDLDQEIIRILRKVDLVPLLSSDETLKEMPKFRYDEYVRISREKAILRV